jgi:hypothetical protein
MFGNRHFAALAGAGLAMTLVAASAMAQQPGGPGGQNNGPDTPGTGPFPAMKEVDPTLPDHVVYRPADLDGLGEVRLGVYAWGNGGCSDDAASTRFHLLEVASHGYLVIASGGIYSGPGATERPGGPRQGAGGPGAGAPGAGAPGAGAPANLPLPATTAEQLRDAIDWALAENEREASPYYGKIDPEGVAVSGFSCGGIQALMNAADPRVATAVVMNSGMFTDGVTRMGGMEGTKAILADLHFPTLYVLGGPTDIAYENGMSDYAAIEHVPVAVANIDKGHDGTYWEENGGAAAAVVVDWLAWRLRGDAEAGAQFVGEACGLCESPEWTYESKSLE